MSHYNHFTTFERELLLLGISFHLSIRNIAKILGRAPSSVSREIKRNSVDGVYSGSVANDKYLERRLNCKPKYKLDDEELKETIQNLITKDNLSPEAISNTLTDCKISYGTIYNAVNKGKLDLKDKQENRIKKYLFFKGKKRHKKGIVDNRGKLCPEQTINDRPDSINHREEFGHWEMDTVLGKHKKSCFLTIVERVSRYSVILKIKGKTSKDVFNVLIDTIGSLRDKIKSITPDNGKEFACYKLISQMFKIPFYFAMPSSPWQRGTNEYTNRLIRYYIPKGTDIDKISNERIKEIQDKLNARPRKCLNWKTPNELFDF